MAGGNGAQRRTLQTPPIGGPSTVWQATPVCWAFRCRCLDPVELCWERNMSADENGRSYRRLTDTAGRTGQGQPASPRERRRSGRRPATSGRHRAHRLRAVPTERAVTTDAPSPTRWVAPEAVWVADSAARSVEVGSMLGNRYRLERVLGAGGSATVFRGTD